MAVFGTPQPYDIRLTYIDSIIPEYYLHLMIRQQNPPVMSTWDVKLQGDSQWKQIEKKSYFSTDAWFLNY